MCGRSCCREAISCSAAGDEHLAAGYVWLTGGSWGLLVVCWLCWRRDVARGGVKAVGVNRYTGHNVQHRRAGRNVV